MSLFWSLVSHWFHLLVPGSCKANSLSKQFSGPLQDLSGQWTLQLLHFPTVAPAVFGNSSKPVSEIRINVKDNKTLMKYFDYSQANEMREEPRKRRIKSLEKCFPAGQNQFSSRGKQPRKSTRSKRRSVEKSVFTTSKTVREGLGYFNSAHPYPSSVQLQSCRRILIF